MQRFDVAMRLGDADRARLPRRSLLPRGGFHAVREVAVWAGFAVAYEAVRGAAGHEDAAMRNARTVVDLERRLVGLLELEVQRPLLRAGGQLLLQLADWTYWLAQFVVVAGVVAWIYLRRYEAYPRLRNAIIAANTVGLAGYLLFPLAPPRLVPGYGFVDALARGGPLRHGAGLVALFSNPYAAMPSLHAADALLLGLALATVTRSLVLRLAALLWPAWVSFCLVATGNHYWIDIVAGGLLGAAAWIATSRARRGAPAKRNEELAMITTEPQTGSSRVPDEVVLTPEGHAALLEEHRMLTTLKRPDVASRLAEAVEVPGDLSDNAEYLQACAELELIDARIQVVERRLASARVIRADEVSDTVVGLGSEVVLEDVDDGTREEYLLVSSPESDPAEGRLSNECPVGSAIAGHPCGDTVEVHTPHRGVRHVRIVGLRKRRPALARR